MRFLIAFAAPALLLAGCATAPLERDFADFSSADGGRSAYGMFLAGQAALNDGRNDEATRYFERARIIGDVDATSAPQISESAFTAALLAGEVTRAAAIAPRGEAASDAIRRIATLTVGVEDLASGRGKSAQAAFASPEIGFPHKSAASLLAPWAAAQAGDVEGSLVRPVAPGDKLVEVFGLLGQGLLFERARRYDEAETDFKAVNAGAASEMMVLAYGGFLERRGRRLDAVALYETALARAPESAALIEAKARADGGKSPPPAPTLRQGAAQALMAPTASMITARQTQIGLAYLRLVLRLDPARDDAWLTVGDLLAADVRADAAREAYGRVKRASAEYSVAQAKVAWTYQTAGDGPAAILAAREAAAGGDTDARVNLADLLRANEQYDEAVSILDEVLAQETKPDWRLLYARGVAYERLGDWPSAEADLKAAVALRPDEPELLNYLGYMWIDRGENVKEGMAMVEKAVAANPRSGAMIDSLGWAYYRLGDYEKALEKLELAIEFEAGDPEINSHLGDVYWKVGRRNEALFQWNRVLTLNPEPKLKAEIEAKIASPSGPDGPAQKVAGQ